MMHITLHLTSDPVGAEVYRMPQGVRVGKTPFDDTMDAGEGEIVLILKKQGYEDKEIALPADRDSDRTMALTRVVVKGPTHDGASKGAGSADLGTPVGGSLDPFEKVGPKRIGRKP
jgi:hypothetical protein